MKTQYKPHTQGQSRLRNAVGLLFAVAAVYLLARHWHTVDSSLRVARAEHVSWLLSALGCMVATTLVAAAIYGTLAIQRLRYAQTIAVEIAAGFVNRIFPSGLGSLGLHGVYLYKRRHTVSEATAVVSVNNLVGIMAHLSLLGALLFARPHVLGSLHVHVPVRNIVSVAVALLLLGAVVCMLPVVRRQTAQFMHNLLHSFKKVGPTSVIRAWLLALILTTLYVLILWSSGRAVDVNLSVLQMFVVFTAGMFSGTIVPLPGGLVGMEAGLLVGLVAYGVPATRAGAVVVTFRLVTYWLPIVPGVVALFWARRSQLV